jgi:NAD-dependent SIR2 family protein deacetylase
MNEELIEQAQTALDGAEYVVILAGAGMSAELGLPVYYKGKDVRYGDQVMPSGLTAMEHANAELWEENRELQIEFFHESLQQIIDIFIEDESNHYHILYNYLKRENKKYFVMTSNVDRSFGRSGFAESRIYEIHGTRLKSQCLDHPYHGVFPTLCNNEKTLCPVCQGDTRPNVMFFGDYVFNDSVALKQQNNYANYRSDLLSKKAVALEIGAGNTVATIRNQSAILNHHFDTTVIRINTDDDDGYAAVDANIPPSNTPFIKLAMTASEGIKVLTKFDENKDATVPIRQHSVGFPGLDSF